MEPDALSSPVLIWASIIVAVAVVIAGSVPKVLGPLGKGLDEWQARRRAARLADDDADIRERDRQIAFLERRLAEQDAHHAAYRRRVAAREARWRAERIHHDAWDYRAARDAAAAGRPLPPAPEYLTPDPPEEEPS